MPDFWDKLFKTNLNPGDSVFAIQGVAAVISLYAEGSITTQQARDLILDSHGDPLTNTEATEASLLLTNIDNATGTGVVLEFNRAKEAHKVIDVLHIVELGWTDKATAKAFLGV